jgi:hypothetical protein
MTHEAKFRDPEIHCLKFGDPSDTSCQVQAPPMNFSRWRIIRAKVKASSALRLPALMDLYIHPLYVIVSKILFSILNSPVSIHPLYHPLFTISTVGPTRHFI